jgi:predicted AlkP superfamily phosphohydrolase/phosphomutase
VYSPGRVPAILEELNSNLDHRLKVAKYLKEKYPSNLFFLHLWGIDRLQHELWHILDPSHPDFNVKEHREYFPQIVDFYKRIDSALEELAQGFDRILIISDHGFGPITKYLIMNLWLVQEGFLVLEKSAKTSLQNFVFRLGFTPGQIYRLAMRLGFANFRLSQGVGERFKFFHFLENFFLSLGNIDWNKTRAYSKGNFGQIYLNLKAREPFGSIEPGSVEEWEIRGKIVESLRKFKDPETGEKIVGEIFEKESIYHGSFIDMAPEITFLPVNMAYKALGTFEFASNHVIEHAFGNFGDHRMNGILMGMGRGIKQGSSALNARLTDILPTVLWLLGIKDTAFDVDGRILFEIMEDSLKACPKEQSMQRQQYPSGERQSFEPDFSDLNKVRELLKKYGYFV